MIIFQIIKITVFYIIQGLELFLHLFDSRTTKKVLWIIYDIGGITLNKQLY